MPDSAKRKRHQNGIQLPFANKHFRKSQRGATNLQRGNASRHRSSSWLRAITRLMNAIPWRQGFIHASIFCFWLLLITGLLQGAKWIDRPVKKIQVVGDFEHIQRSVIQNELSALFKKSFFTLDLNAIQRQLEARAWVKKAEVERLWPDVLRVELAEENVVALWNNHGFVNAHGEVIVPDRPPHLPELPNFYGDTDQAVTMLQTYYRWRSKMVKVNLDIASLRMTRREAWQIGFAGDWYLNLGKANVEQRLQRFIAVYGKRLYLDVANIRAVDARYTQGVSVAWKVPPVTPVQG